MAVGAEEIRQLIERHAERSGRLPVDGLGLYVGRAPEPPQAVLFRPMVYLVLQGAKQLLLDDRTVSYRGGEYVAMCIDLPALAQVTEASAESPYLAIELGLDGAVLADLAAELPPLDRTDGEAFSVRSIPESVFDPILRLVRLLDAPADAKVLADGVKREILYRMLSSPGGESLIQLVTTDSTVSRIRGVTDWMREHLDTPVQVDGLARQARMGVTTFHRHFKAATGSTPADFHKRLRLHEARRLIAVEGNSMSRIAAMIGYASPSHFSRDYRRAFGATPIEESLRFGSRRTRSAS